MYKNSEVGNNEKDRAPAVKMVPVTIICCMHCFKVSEIHICLESVNRQQQQQHLSSPVTHTLVFAVDIYMTGSLTDI